MQARSGVNFVALTIIAHLVWACLETAVLRGNILPRYVVASRRAFCTTVRGTVPTYSTRGKPKTLFSEGLLVTKANMLFRFASSICMSS